MCRRPQPRRPREPCAACRVDGAVVRYSLASILDPGLRPALRTVVWLIPTSTAIAGRFARQSNAERELHTIPAPNRGNIGPNYLSS